MVPRKQAGHMTCTRPQAERQILLATRASSTHDPFQTWLAGQGQRADVTPLKFPVSVVTSRTAVLLDDGSRALIKPLRRRPAASGRRSATCGRIASCTGDDSRRRNAVAPHCSAATGTRLASQPREALKTTHPSRSLELKPAHRTSCRVLALLVPVPEQEPGKDHSFSLHLSRASRFKSEILLQELENFLRYLDAPSYPG
jgi:hypothetical protein